MQTLAEMLETQRRRRALTQDAAAEQIGISERSYRRYLRGGTPSLYNARLIAEWLGRTTSEIVEAGN